MKRTILTLLISVYMLIALLNMSVVQTALGSLASAYFSKEWNTKVHIGGISLNIFNHLSLYNVYLEHPNGKVILDAQEIRCSFDKFPLQKGLHVKKVMLKNTTFNLAKGDDGLNLRFIIDYFKPKEPKPKEDKPPFIIDVKQLVFKNVNFSLNMQSAENETLKENGVNVRDMAFNHINADIRDILVIGDSIRANFKNFSTQEKSGFILEQMQMEAMVCGHEISAKNAHIITPTTDLSFDARLTYETWGTMSSYIDSVYMEADFKKGTKTNMSDAGYWAETLWGMKHRATLEGKFRGTVSNLRTDYFLLTFGQKSKLEGRGSIVGLIDIDNTVIEAYVDNLETSVEDVNTVKFPEKLLKLQLPDFLKTFGDIKMKAYFKGKIKDFEAQADLKTDKGDVNAKLAMRYENSIKDYQYKGNLILKNFQVTAPQFTMLEKTNLDVNFEGQGTNLNTLKAKVDGESHDFVLYGNLYDSVRFKASAFNKNFFADLQLYDDAINLDFEGKIILSDSIPQYNFRAKVDNAHLGSLHFFTPRDTNSVFSTELNVDFSGNNADNFRGSIVANNTYYTENGKEIFIKNLTVQAQENYNNKVITIASDMFDFDMSGYFKFEDFDGIYNKLMDSYAPQYFYRASMLKAPHEMEPQEFNFTLNLKQTDYLTNIFVPALKVSPNTVLKGKYSEMESLSLELQCDSVRISNFDLQNISMNSQPKGDYYNTQLSVGNLLISDLVPLENVSLTVNAKPDILNLNLLWKDTMAVIQNGGNINLSAYVEPFAIDIVTSESDFRINGKDWTMPGNNKVEYSATKIAIENLGFVSGNESVVVTGKISKEEGADELRADFKDFELSDFNVLLEKAGMECSGLMNGQFYLHELSKRPYFKSNLVVNNLKFNGEKFGNASILAELENENKRIKLNFKTDYTGNIGTIQPIVVSGYFYPTSKTNNYDFDIRFQNFKLKTIEGYTKSALERLEGNVSGDLTVKGIMNAPKINGELTVDLGKVKVNFLNTTYSFADKIKVTEKGFFLNNFTLLDSNANVAKVSGQLLHDNFKNMRFDFNLQAQNFMFLNTTAASGNPYYGRVIADGQAVVKGDFSTVEMNIEARTRKGTDLYIPVNSKVQVSQHEFIQFVQKDTLNLVANKFAEDVSKLNFKININVDATPDARISIPMDFNQMSGDLSAMGTGMLHLAIDTKKNDFKMFGDYEVASGTFGLNLGLLGANLIRKEFQLEKGGSITWSGDPTGAILDVSGIYNVQKVPTSPLFSNAEVDYGKKDPNETVNVQSVIVLKGKLLQPDISFDIRMPHTSQATQDRIFTVIDRSNELQMQEQSLSLLLLMQFAPVGSYTSGAIGTGATNSVYESILTMVSNMLFGAFSSYVDVSIGHKSLDQTDGGTQEQWDLNVSKNVGRFYFEGSVGVNNATNTNTSATSSTDQKYFGEFLVDYRLTENFHLQAYNRPNTNEFSRDESPYVQGAGILYQKDFNKMIEIFKRKKKPKDKKAEEQDKKETKEDK